MSLQAKSPAPVPPDAQLQFPATTARTWMLPNGLGLIVQEDRSAPVVSVQAWCATGSIHEGAKLGAGLSHMLEHMLFKGTKSRSPNEIAQKVQDAGGYINAYTSFDRTVYWIDIPCAGVGTAIDILADAMMNSTLPPEEFTKEQEVIRREFAMGYDDPDRMSQHALFDLAFKEHPYRLPVIGHFDVFNQLTRDQVMEYYRARYVPNNLFFVVVGDVQAEAVHEQLRATFAEHPRSALPSTFIPAEPPQLGRRELHQEFPTELTRLEMAWHIPALTHPDLPALDLLSGILGEGRSSRAYRGIREQAGLAHSISAYCYSPGSSGLFGIGATLDPEHREAVEKGVLELIAEVQANGVTEAELAKAKKMTLSHQMSALVTMRGKASDLGSNWLLTRNLNFSRDYLASLQEVSAEEVRRVAATYLCDRNLTVTSLNPPGSLQKASETGRAVAAGAMQKFELGNGIRLLVREDARLPLVSAVAVFKAGLLAEAATNNGVTRLLSRTILKGTATRTAEQIADEIEAVGGGLGSDGGNNSFSLALRVMKPDLELGLQLLADVIAHPIFPEKNVEREKQIQLAQLKEDEEELTVVARNLMRKELFGGHPYGFRTEGTVETVTNLTRADLVALHGEYVVGRNCVISVFGDVKAAEVKAWIEELLGGLPAGEAKLTAVPEAAPLVADSFVQAEREKAQAVLMIGYQGAHMFDADHYALELIDEASSDLGSRFFVRIREQMGLAYFVGTSQVAGLARGPFVFYLGTSPEKVEAVRREFVDEIGKLAREGLTAEELARAKEKLIGQQKIRHQSNDSFAYAAALDELYGLGFQAYQEVEAKVAAVTLEEVRRVAQKYFLNQPHVTAIVQPPAKPAPLPE